MSDFDYRRRRTSTVGIGGIPLGGDNPIRVQSMTSTSTMDTEGSLAQIRSISAAGASYVRLTAQGVREAENIGLMSRTLESAGEHIPLVADIHFNPRAALAAAAVVQKVRINPGNFVDPGRTFRRIEYTDAEYAEELKRIEDGLLPLLDICREHGTALRIGVNHGSLSDRIMSRYGDTPAGMVESAMEFLRVCRTHDFDQVVISIKASNTVVMVETVRLLVAAMESENMAFPLHLGVTEAGDGEDGRVKSAVGIGALLAEGIGDTIRVSLSEDPALEVPVAQELVDYITARASAPLIGGEPMAGYNPVNPQRIPSAQVGNIGSDRPAVVVSDAPVDMPQGQTAPDYVYAEGKLHAADGTALNVVEVDAAMPDTAVAKLKAATDAVAVLHSSHANPVGELRAAAHALRRAGVTNPIIMRLTYGALLAETLAIRAAADSGALLLTGHRDGLWLRADGHSNEELTRLTFGILQAARQRITRTEYISCPGCGRTLFDLQSVIRRVKEATSHLNGLKIGIMGCIVNGPGEMADADYGYVGAAAGHVSLYRGKECVEKNIPESEAIGRLIAIIKESGDWKDA